MWVDAVDGLFVKPQHVESIVFQHGPDTLSWSNQINLQEIIHYASLRLLLTRKCLGTVTFPITLKDDTADPNVLLMSSRSLTMVAST